MDWIIFDQCISELAKKINIEIDGIAAVMRGGMVPARVLATKLSIEQMYCLAISKTGNQPIVTPIISDDLAGQTILVVEDALETGVSLEKAAEYLRSQGVAVKTAALYYTPHTKQAPDYSLGLINKIPQFPWE